MKYIQNIIRREHVQNHDSFLLRDYRFIFIVGATGSGTTLLTRILSSPKTVVGLGGNFTTVSERDKAACSVILQFDKATIDLWDRKATHEKYRKAKREIPVIIDSLLGLENYSHVSHILYKRSAPFFKGDRYRPDLSDLLDLFGDLRIIVIYRDPKASTFSSFRRGFAENLRQCAVFCEEQLTYLSSQLATLDHDVYQVINYEEFCSRPGIIIKKLAEICQLPENILLHAVERENVKPGRNEQWLQELDTSERDFLIKFFNTRRLSQWPLFFPP